MRLGEPSKALVGIGQLPRLACEVLINLVLGGGYVLEDIDDEHGQLTMVEWVLRIPERAVVRAPVLGDNSREGECGHDRERSAQVEGKEIPSRPAVAVIERMDVLEEVVTDNRSVGFGNLVGIDDGEHLIHALDDGTLRKEAFMQFLSPSTPDLDPLLAEQSAVGCRVAEVLASHDGVVDLPNVLGGLRERPVGVAEPQV